MHKRKNFYGGMAGVVFAIVVAAAGILWESWLLQHAPVVRPTVYVLAAVALLFGLKSIFARDDAYDAKGETSLIKNEGIIYEATAADNQIIGSSPPGSTTSFVSVGPSGRIGKLDVRGNRMFNGGVVAKSEHREDMKAREESKGIAKLIQAGNEAINRLPQPKTKSRTGRG